MSTIVARNGEHRDPLVERALEAGFELGTHVTETGQTVWEWCRGSEPRPQFVTERVARYWMFRWLDQFEDAGR